MKVSLKWLGEYVDVPEDLKAAVQSQFWAGCCGDERAAETIGRVFREQGYLCDPHTATAWAVAEDYGNQTGSQRPMVVLSTASPYKFPTAVLEALGVTADADEFTQMEQLETATGVPVPRNLATLRGRQERHTSLIEKTDMLDFVKAQ